MNQFAIPYTIRWYRDFLGKPNLIYEGVGDGDWLYFKVVLATARLIDWDAI